MLEGSDEVLTKTLADSAPHLTAGDREQLRNAYLGNLTWRSACDAVGLARFRMPRRLRMPLPERLQVVKGQLIAGEIERGVKQGRRVAVGKHETVAVGPFEVRRIMRGRPAADCDGCTAGDPMAVNGVPSGRNSS